MKRILYVTMNLNSGGAERQIVSTACEFKKRGYDVEVACFTNGDFHLRQLQDNDIKVHWLLCPNPIKRMFVFRKFIRKGQYDAVISYLESSNFLNTFAAIGGRTWKVITGERSAKEEHLTTFQGKIFAWMQRYADAIVCNSENARQMWIRHYPKYENKLKTIYNTVTVKPTDTEYIPRRDGKTHLIVAASYQRLKNPLNLIEAVKLLSEEDKEMLVIDRYGSTRVDDCVFSESQQRVTSYDLSNTIRLHDVSNDIPNLMVKADVVGLFSSVEGLPNAICEGMTLGKPIIMTRVSDYNTLVDDSNGWLCDWDDVEGIKNSLLNVINETTKILLEKGELSKEKAEMMFEQEVNMNRWVDII